MASADQDSDMPVLTMSGIEKSYGHVRALRGVDFELRRGEVMALLGENGAGKSTLVKILAGLETPDTGVITVNGVATELGTSRRSQQAGIAVAEQEISVIGPLSAAENIFLGGIPFPGPWSKARLARAARPHLDAVGLNHVQPGTLVEDLSIAERQLIEIARLLARDSRILILDEPTAALSDAEIDRILRTITALAAAGRSIIYVTHRLGEVFRIANRVTVFRGGESNPPQPIAELTVQTLIEKMIGRPLTEMYPERGAAPGQIILETRELQTAELAEPISIQVRSGEILGIAGQLGSGTGALIRAIAGTDIATTGAVLVDGKPLPPAHGLGHAIRSGIGYCSGDRKLDGIFAGLSVGMNLTAPALRKVSPRSIMSGRRELGLGRRIAEQFALNPQRIPHRAGTLSGGNQQKVALGKWLGIEPRVLLIQEPTRGVDVGARAEIYGHLRRLAGEGLAIVFASSDLEEVHGLSDTVITMFRGHVVRTVQADATSTHDLLRDITHPAEALT